MINPRILLCLCTFFLLTYDGASFAAEKAQSLAARQLAELSFNKTAYYDNAMRYALLAIKDRYESNPKTKPYSAIIINAVMEVMEAYIGDPETQAKVKGISAQLFMEEFTETELREMATFYRSKTGQKALSKLPVIMRRQWELESQVTMPPKYEQMIVDKITALQRHGKLPEEFK
jgi:hypothetical protein